jgi:hypothetical protein
MNERPVAEGVWSLRLVAYLVAIIPISGGVAAVAATSLDGLGATSSDAATLLRLGLLAVGYALPIAIAVVWAKRQGYSAPAAFGVRGFRIMVGLALAFLAAVVARIVAFVYLAVFQLLAGSIPDVPDVTRLFTQAPIGIAATIALTVFIAPLAEELLFRGVIFPGLRDVLGRSAGIGISAALFALFHFSAELAVPYLVLGVLLALVVERTRSVWPAVIGHALFNVQAIIALYALVGSPGAGG